MTAQFADFTRQAAVDGAISDDEILQLRAAGWANGTITREEASAIFSLQRAIADRTPVWSDFFVEAIKEYVLNGTEPRGYASDSEAGWLIVEIERDGHLCSMTELQLLVEITDKACNVPEALKYFVLREIERAVLTGVGPTRDGGELSNTHVTPSECTIMRRVIFGQASDRPAAVSQREAEMLFRLKDATLEAANAPEFMELFVQGVGNYLMGFASPSAQLSRERMVELESFVSRNKPNIGHFMGRMAQSAPNAFGVVFGQKGQLPGRDELVQEAASFSLYEQDWLDQQIAANGLSDHYDQALMAFIAEELGEA
ncbi:hypothetical protein GCM10009127_01950 [Alteraurantiacibacter aestuarii]|uniref:Uncharacterized protein n=1 Tax=Alteraurantiacibacter aestuarii TaxID=650004 RepID=A0A844ZJA6_9SPHN|nr:hypothetical protein [Alteraurantiacibacter aestuarii]MXO88551.1 hypothetical protein [Alteraurantiacibacter aestuarii]